MQNNTIVHSKAKIEKTNIIMCVDPMNGVKHICLNNHVLGIWTFLETYRPQNLNIYIECGVESVFLVENMQCLHLDQVLTKIGFYRNRFSSVRGVIFQLLFSIFP